MQTDPENTEKYNGWTNQQTWQVKLWIDNEEPNYRLWRDNARIAKNRWEDQAKYYLADDLKAWHEEDYPLENPSVYSDLLETALDQVNWEEIADSLLED